MNTFSTSSRQLVSRALPSKFLVAAIVFHSVISALLLASIVFLLVRIWKQVMAERNTSPPSVAPKAHGAVSERKQSDWARKNSNVLWSMYIEEDDLKAQFAVSPKSRLFSIGSVSTVDQGSCPLDRRHYHANPLGQHKIVEEMSPKTEESTADLRSRTPYEHQTTPTKNVPRARALSQPCCHKYSSSIEELAKCKAYPRGSLKRLWKDTSTMEGHECKIRKGFCRYVVTMVE
ncbi:uncharacterized protein Z519_09058 [Cladophialophora bantiana CBS 173.52]|uniref:Uncharacterized protein n=1 Tax=Cladophialophora bantiana (strain ATCC 10958 / CBS 173.52 / CDC B-1940 / NIH 8579) TaxID=1442370 RepID=A0A0D2HAY2_CLAB1|nr:uncharacterized protein Z519_09058 [Cladophialophora bantiana CBS 173.52]KIW90413.1 hypothetical protein Z519_09058 [Cladophialophora bantiana CBS 173.52]